MTPRSPDELLARPIRDRARIEAFLRRDAAAHVYALADLDEPHWSHTRWFGAFEGDDLRALCLLLEGLGMPILYAIAPAGDPPTRWLLEQVRPDLPDAFFYNLPPGAIETLAGDRRIDSHGSHWKMRLDDPSACDGVDEGDISPVGAGDAEEVRAFLDGDAYRTSERLGRFFDARMLATGCYWALREDGRLVALGGVHVHSQRYGVAAIGNVVTRPDRRGRGLARRLSAAVVRGLRGDIATIGLNVHRDNEPALRCYRRLGFRPVLAYEEGVATRL